MKNSLYRIIVCFIATFVSSMVIGISMVCIPLQLSEGGGFSDFHTTLLFSLEAAVSIFLALKFQKLVKRFGINELFIFAGVLRAIAFLLLLFFNGLAASYFILLTLGTATFFHTIICQYWLNTIPIQKFKGVLYSLHGATIAGGVAVGAGIFPLLGELAVSFDVEYLSGIKVGFICSFFLSLSLVLILSFGRIWLVPQETKNRIMEIVMAHRGIYLAIALCGISYFGVSWFMVLYGVRNGMDIPAASLLLGMFMLGGICIDPLVSLIGEKVDRRYILVLACLCCCVFVIFLPIAIYYEGPSYFLLFLWGGLISSMYSCCLALLEEKLGEDSQLAAHSAFSFMENIGALIGLLAIGAILSFVGSDGFSYVVVFFNMLYFTYALHLFLKGKAVEFESVGQISKSNLTQEK